jgi:thiol-disulfide isomerase/thioredoxin
VFSRPAPAADDYALPDLDGKLHRAPDHRGKWLVINFRATWCLPWLREMPELEDYYRANPARVEFWGVTFEDSELAKILEFVERVGVSYPILGYGQSPQTGYGKVRVLPTTLVVDPGGELHHRFEGPITAADLRRVTDD